MINKKVFVVLINSFLLIKCEDNSTVAANESLGSTLVSTETLSQNNGTDGSRGGKQDGIFEVIGDAISAAAAAASVSVVDNVFGNQLITTGEYCGYRRSNRFCGEYCHDSFRGPMVGYCRNGICVCECDYYQCERYCRRYWDHGDYDYDYDHDYDYDYDYPRRRHPNRLVEEIEQSVRGAKVVNSQPLRGRRRAYCSLRGCRCD